MAEPNDNTAAPPGPPDDKAPDDNKHKLLQLFADVVDVKRPDPEKALRTPTAQLAAARQQAGALIEGTVRPEFDNVDTHAAGRQRFPELHGVGARFADGLSKNPDIVAEVLASPDDLTSWIALDQAIGRYIFAGQLLARGGETGAVLAGTAAQKVCLDTLDQARTRIKDASLPIETRADINTALEEPFRIEAEQKQRQQQAQATASRDVQSYRDQAAQAAQTVDLSNAVEKYLSAEQPKGNLP